MIVRVQLPFHLCTLARVSGGEVCVETGADPLTPLTPLTPPTLAAVLDAIERDYPMLRGAIRDHGGGKRRAFIRFFAAGQDLSHQPPDQPLPEAVVAGIEPLMVVGAIAGG